MWSAELVLFTKQNSSIESNNSFNCESLSKKGECEVNFCGTNIQGSTLYGVWIEDLVL